MTSHHVHYVFDRPFDAYTPSEYYEYVKSLRKESGTPESKAADGITLRVKGSKVTVRCTRDEKLLTQLEVTALALEYNLDHGTLIALLTDRKFKIVNEQGEQTNVRAKPTRAGRKSRAASKTNAHLDQESRPLPGVDQFFITVSDSGVPTQGSLQSEPGTETD